MIRSAVSVAVAGTVLVTTAATVAAESITFAATTNPTATTSTASRAVSSVRSTTGTTTSAAASTSTGSTSCPKLMVYAMQGTGESSPDASQTTDSGALGAILGPVMQEFAGQGVIDRKYVPYEASFGGAPGTGAGRTDYARSVTGGAKKMSDMIAADAARCPGMLVATLGYSQGAGGTSMVTKAIADGSGPVPADRLAMGGLLSNPQRAAGTGVLPGKSGQDHPDPAPTTTGEHVTKVSLAETSAPAEGGGIGPQSDIVRDFGPASGRVASWCQAGDLACDTPAGAPIARVLANLAGQSKIDPQDPVGSLTTVANALATTTIKTGVDVINKDISGTSLTDLSYSPEKTLSQRMAEQSDPRSQSSDPAQALMKLGTIGLNTVVAVAKEVITPANIAELAVIGFANPQAALATFVGKLGQAVVRVGGQAVDRLSGQVMQVVEKEVDANRDLPRMVADVNYWQTAQRHGSYFTTPSTAEGKSAADVTRQWLTAVATDLGGQPNTSTGTGAASVAASTGPSSVLTIAPSSTAPSSVLTITPSAAPASAHTVHPSATAGSAHS